MKISKAASIFLILPPLLFSCSSTKEIQKPPQLTFDYPVLSKAIKKEGNQGVPVNPTTTFSTGDPEVIASLKLNNLWGKHKLRWEWYDPNGDRYCSSGNYKIKASRGKYIPEVTVWHKLSIQGEKAANYPGDWKVNIYLDKDFIASKSFKIKSGLPPILSVEEISFSERILDAGETAELKVTLKNAGPGDANDVYMTLSGNLKGVSFDQKKAFHVIRKRGGSETIKIPLRAGLDLPTGEAYLDIQVVEPHFRVKIRGKRLTFQTRKFRNPELVIAKFAAVESESSKKNRQIDLNEIFDLKFAVQNVGKGTAEDVKINVENNQQGVMFLGIGKGENLIRQSPHFDRIDIGKYKIINYRYFASSDFRGKELRFSIKASEKYGRYGFSEKKVVAINTELKEEGYIRKVAVDSGSVTSGVIIEDIPAFEIDVDVNIPKTRMKNPNGIAVVIGNRDYQNRDVTAVKFARHDAEIVKHYLIKTLGYKEGNILYETDVTKGDFEALFGSAGDHKGRLYDCIKPYKSDVFIYYSGHGAPDPDTEKAYFVPADSNPAKVNLSGYSLDLFYENLAKLDAKSITVVIDACFSGGTSTGEMLIASASPIGIVVRNPTIAKKNTIILTSSKGDQISSWYDEKRHSLFTYFFLKALGGSADKDGNKELTFGEIYDFVSDRAEGVPYFARRLHGRTQSPTLEGGNKERVLVSY